jgi:Secretory lipase
MQVGTRKDNLYTQLQTAIMILSLNQGWMTAVVDDGGLWGVFGWFPIWRYYRMTLTSLIAAGRGAAYKNLDAIRAIKNSTSFTGINPDATTVTYGYSGGAFGGEWVRLSDAIGEGVADELVIRLQSYNHPMLLRLR